MLHVSTRRVGGTRGKEGERSGRERGGGEASSVDHVGLLILECGAAPSYRVVARVRRGPKRHVTLAPHGRRNARFWPKDTEDKVCESLFHGEERLPNKASSEVFLDLLDARLVQASLAEYFQVQGFMIWR